MNMTMLTTVLLYTAILRSSHQATSLPHPLLSIKKKGGAEISDRIYVTSWGLNSYGGVLAPAPLRVGSGGSNYVITLKQNSEMYQMCCPVAHFE